ncbi:MAG: hypothetical protein LQ352_007773 [Teloschistes flavicans]|nr:MAG: hypothetical protein LQ352_007773 [Teloschistes flavicans]
MPFFKKPLAGPGYIILNVIRALNIIALLAVIVASFSMLVKTFIVSKFFFFDAVSHVITAFLSMFLILTETSLFRSYFSRSWPLLSPSHGFVTLGILMCIVGVSVLGNLNKEATSQKSLGTSYWRIVISSGILCMILGVANIFASYIFRQKKLGVTARMVRAHGAVAAQKLPLPVTTPNAYGTPATSIHRTDTKHRPFNLARSDSVPSYGHATSPMKMNDPRRNISAPMNNVHPNQFVKFDERCEQVGPPDLAHHPAMMGERF